MQFELVRALFLLIDELCIDTGANLVYTIMFALLSCVLRVMVLLL